ncbi:MAG: hypothetical protein DDT40_00611 [candidate division WS2 bacterium]|uniref:DUF503 domain-containing protein n=1 Tax=Psychracetigena formicireducens TaxID=2986056 RepID=A0A9E2F112_PSYF1|nr:hypothetical protein [Candidatus Psychracetigena formicireducens]MBT9144267.1 hypothetical protein [Candidatus Psychracetigena formicireducens]MBT9150439.1 hypothetical protein [Candidatus Psychracetigena formicireducens]
MSIGTGKVVLRLPGIKTLKDKRNLMRRISAFLKKNYELSLVEINTEDVASISVLELTRAAHSRMMAMSTLNKAIDAIEDNFDCLVVGREVKVLEV